MLDFVQASEINGTNRPINFLPRQKGPRRSTERSVQAGTQLQECLREVRGPKLVSETESKVI